MVAVDGEAEDLARAMGRETADQQGRIPSVGPAFALRNVRLRHPREILPCPWLLRVRHRRPTALPGRFSASPPAESHCYRSRVTARIFALKFPQYSPLIPLPPRHRRRRRPQPRPRYVTRPEKQQLIAQSPALGRPTADCAALIPLRKNPAWWSLTQDERRHIFEEQSHHTQIGLDYLPAIARRLPHCRDLGDPQPFDFLT